MACENETVKINNYNCIDFTKLEELIINILNYNNQSSDTCVNKNVVDQILYTALRNTDTYKQCIELYNNYIYDYIRFLHSLGITDSDEIAIAYKKMLDNGYLSYKKYHHYDNRFQHIYKKKLSSAEFMELNELEGCYIVTGASVCRHMSSFLTDLESRAGYTSHNSYVTVIKKKVKTSCLDANHQITLIADRDLYYGYCPVSGYFIELDDLDETNQIIIGKNINCKNGRIGQYSYLIKLEDYYKIEDNPSTNYVDLYNSVNTDSYKKLNIEELCEKDKYISEKLTTKKDELDSFYESSKNTLQTINNSINIMIPRKRVKQLRVK